MYPNFGFRRKWNDWFFRGWLVSAWLAAPILAIQVLVLTSFVSPAREKIRYWVI